MPLGFFGLVLVLALGLIVRVETVSNELVAQDCAIGCGKYVMRYHVGNFPTAILSGDVSFDEEMTDYIKQIGYRGGPIIVFGLLAPLVFFIWGCCSCLKCGCCKRPYELEESTRAKLGVLVFLGMCGVGIIIFFGYGTNAQQALAIKSVQNSVSGVTTWADEATDLIKSVLEQPKLVEEKILFIDASIDTLINTVGIQEIADQGEALKQMLADVQLQYAELSSEFDAVNETVGGLSTMVSGGGNQAIEFLTKYEDMRSFAIKVTFSGLLGLIMLQGVIALSDVYCREGRRPNQFGCFGKCAAPVFSGIFLFVMFVLFLLGFAFYLLTAVTSDICVQPNAILDELLSGMDTSSPMTSSVGSGGASSDSGSGGASSDIAAELARSGSSSLDGSSGLENSVAGDPMEFFFRCNTYTAEDQVALNPLMPIFDEIDAGLVMIADETRLIEDAIVLVEAFASVPLIPAASIEAIDTFATDVKGYVVVRDAHRFETRGHCCRLYECLLEVATLLAYPNVL